jgi:hypothetical protein
MPPCEKGEFVFLNFAFLFLNLVPVRPGQEVGLWSIANWEIPA